MKICNKCGYKLQNGEKKCPICNERTNKAILVDNIDNVKIDEIIASVRANGSNKIKHKQHPLLLLFSLIFLSFCIVFFLYGSGVIGNSPLNSKYITLEEFNSLKTGMTYEEVCEIIGSEGELVSEVNITEETYHTKMYIWYGSGITGANANFTFENNKLMSKAQMGLN